jgi:rRNA processing protein Gar1
LKSLGNSILYTVGGQFLIKSKNIPKLYSNIVTRDKRLVGKVNDIIGPVMDPHILVKPSKEIAKNPESIKGKELFEGPNKRNQQRSLRWKKKR